jgi:hypothetical protein
MRSIISVDIDLGSFSREEHGRKFVENYPSNEELLKKVTNLAKYEYKNTGNLEGFARFKEDAFNTNPEAVKKQKKII